MSPRPRDPRRPMSALPRLALSVLAALLLPGAAPAAAGQAPGGAGGSTAAADTAPRFGMEDVFSLQWASDPRVSPDGDRVVYVRNTFDEMEDAPTSDLWIVDADGTRHRALTSATGGESSPRWSPGGDRLLYLAEDDDGDTQIWVRWMDSGETARVTDLGRSPGNPSWSPDGTRIAFTRFVPEEGGGAWSAATPAPPDGADWGEPFEVIDRVNYRADGRGRLPRGHTQVFVVSADGGAPRQVTRGPYDHGGTPVWTPDGEALLISANRREDAALEPADSEIYEVSLEDGSMAALTDRRGPDGDPAVSPDGSRIAYTGYDDRYQGYQVTKLYVMDRDGGGGRVVAEGFDRSLSDPAWSADGRGLYVQYDDSGDTELGWVGLSGGAGEASVEVLTDGLGGLSIGRPYGSGQYHASAGTDRFAVTRGVADRPSDVAVGRLGGADELRPLTALNEDLLGRRRLGSVEEIQYTSSHDGREIEGWIVKPPGFDPSEEYPLVLEIHGGPFAMYGDVFSAEAQLYAVAGYVVLYTNPRGSTSYGQEFGNAIHHAYPGHDFDDLMSGVDAVLDRGYVDSDRLYVTGGSGGGVLTAWIVGHTDRFRAAVSAKPVINWYSWALSADMYVSGIEYWFPGPPWEHRDHYMDRSPLSYVGEVSTPTMLMTGERDFRTPIWESEQFYQALKYREVPTALVRVPDASHGIAARPSNLAAKAAHVLEWFERYGGTDYSSRVSSR